MRTLCIGLGLLLAAAGVLGQTPLEPLYADSTLRIGSGYGSAGDLFALLPGAYYFDRGSIGLPARGALFAAPSSRLHLVYDQFHLDDPLTGRADLNLIPVESIARQTLFAAPALRLFPELAASTTLEIAGRDLAADTLRSQVAYRTGGNGYDDIDVRAGLRYSQHLRINAGGVLKNYAGTTADDRYRAQKITVALSRTLGRQWQANYRLLYNTSDLDLPLFSQPLLAPGLTHPHQKERRYDHGLELRYADRWQTLIQLTDHHRERYGYRHSLWDESTDALRLDLRSMAHRSWRHLDGTAGLAFRSTNLKSHSWGDHAASLLSAWGSVSAQPASALFVTGQLLLQKADGEAVALLPRLQLRYLISPLWQTLAWYERTRSAAALAARYEQSPFAQGDPGLDAERGDQFGWGVRRSTSALELFAAVSACRSADEVLLVWDAGRSAPRYRNQAVAWRYGLDGAATWRISSWLTLWGKAKQMFFQETIPCNQSETAAAGWLQLGHRLFRGDLDIRFRLGCSFWGARRAPLPWYVEDSGEQQHLAAAALPWLQATAVIKDATLFFTLQNPLGSDGAVVGAYPQPKRLIRWGFVWNFYN
ncbi:MAG TPA: TonB-dependent receptor [bacterium]|nr:TonB-dependent receptor [bacterium]HPR87364.1 TonB-dependent receptor [bacterium]